MSVRRVVMVRHCLAAVVAAAVVASAARAGTITLPATTDNPGLITQTASMPLTPTDFSAGGSAGNPLTFQKFDTKNDSLILDSVTLTVHAAVSNQFSMKFYTPATITTSVVGADGGTSGPSISLYQPDGKTPLVTVTSPNETSALTRSVTWGNQANQPMNVEFSSKLDPSSPYYIAPALVEKNQSAMLTKASDLSLFTGTGSIALPVAGTAWARITSSSGNGFGSITTQGTADVTVQYSYHERVPAAQTVPEPASMVLWGLGGVLVALRVRNRSRSRRVA